MGITWAGLAPHPPIIVSDVGGDRCQDVARTIKSMRSLAEDLVAQRPERLVIISPHTPRPYQGISAWMGPSIAGNFAQFGAPNCSVELAVDKQWMTRFASAYGQVHALRYEMLDHGTMVPLWFAVQAGWKGPTCVLGLPWNEDVELDAIGKALAKACNDDASTAVIASGDMSHCLKPDAPCGFSSQGAKFDMAFINHLQNCSFREATAIDLSLQEAAKQDVVPSCRVAWEATNYRHDNHYFYSYEGPFGVGYTVMKFFSEAS